MGTGSFPGVKQPQRGLNHPPPYSAAVKERVELYLYFLLYLYDLFFSERYLLLTSCDTSELLSFKHIRNQSEHYTVTIYWKTGNSIE